MYFHPNFGPGDMGVTSDWKHEHYAERYPNGYVVIWVAGDLKGDKRIAEAHAKHVAAGDAGTPWQRERAKAD